MQVETQSAGNKSITFIMADNEREANTLIDIAGEGQPLEAVLEPSGLYLFPYLKITNKNPLGKR